MRDAFFHDIFPITRISIFLPRRGLKIENIYPCGPKDEKDRLDANWYDYLLPVFALAYLLEDTYKIFYQRNIMARRRILFFNFVFHFFISVGLLLRTIGYYIECLKENPKGSINEIFFQCKFDNPTVFDEKWSPGTYGYGLIGIGTILGSIQILYWTQGWQFMSCSHCQELCQPAIWLLIGCTRVNNQSEARTAS